MMKPICLIPARGGSKGVPRKNIRDMAGKPLLAHTIESALDSNLFSHIFVSTEDKDIATVAKEYGAEIPFMRPKKLAGDSVGMDEVYLHSINSLFKLGYEFEILVHRDCTCPFIRNRDVKGTIELIKKKKSDAVFGVYKQHHNPYFNMLESNEKGFLKLSKSKGKRPESRQKAPIVYQMNGLYTYSVASLLKHKKIFMPKILPFEIPPETGLMIDTEFEFKTVELMLTGIGGFAPLIHEMS